VGPGLVEVHERSFSIPRLRTSRLLFREYRAADLDLFAAHFADPESTRYIGSSSRREAWRLFGSCMGAWVINGVGWWAVELLDAHEVTRTSRIASRREDCGVCVSQYTQHLHLAEGPGRRDSRAEAAGPR
jgi:RimJ/RimL family protein N-acetyltransferase